MAQHSAASKFNADWDFLCHLKDQGRIAAGAWLEQDFDKVGRQSSIDIVETFM
jgi:NTE family protein